ncbi:PadR family transcriptional regulator [Nocardiopsis sp. CC223A]|uniref:PadR family transcriptional regulator n=1 Tax=Nocardiopsis sp. CC223A TaxID=3044051 RepID=UPI00278C810C|nr:PadR family transcriptional regulator [Nocardiopsis sp. CC223A]
MPVKYGLLALLSRGPGTAYQLKKDFDLTTGRTWPLNIGQVSTTLRRLERDGLLERDGGSAGDAAAEPWHLTAAGRDELARWWLSPVSRRHQGRDELMVKLALAVAVPDVDVAALVQRQRSAMQRLLHDVTRARRAVEPGDLTARLVLDHHIFTTEAELRWLDAVEGEVARAGHVPAAPAPTADAERSEVNR